jgi:hypothetical protein
MDASRSMVTSGRLAVRVAAAAMVASGVVGTATAQAAVARESIVLSPAQLPSLAQQDGQGMFLRETLDGKAYLYIARKQGTELDRLDITDPASVRDTGSVPVVATERSDVIATSVNGEFRLGDGVAVPNVHARVTNAQTGTTFLLTASGLYEIRSPDDEMIKRFRDQAYQN